MRDWLAFKAEWLEFALVGMLMTVIFLP